MCQLHSQCSILNITKLLISVQCAETNFAPLQIHQNDKVEDGAVVEGEGVHGHVTDLEWLEKGHIFISRAFKLDTISIYQMKAKYCIKVGFF